MSLFEVCVCISANKNSQYSPAGHFWDGVFVTACVVCTLTRYTSSKGGVIRNSLATDAGHRYLLMTLIFITHICYHGEFLFVLLKEVCVDLIVAGQDICTFSSISGDEVTDSSLLDIRAVVQSAL